MDDQKNKLDDINEEFKSPICFNPEVQKLNESVLTDLELVKPINQDDDAIYNFIFKPSNSLSKITLEPIARMYTTDVNYLKDTQSLLESLDKSNIDCEFNDNKLDETAMAWKEIKDETGFCEKYLYIDFEFGKFINNNATFLQLMCVYNIASPVLSLFLPIFVLIIPFFIVKMKGMELNVNQYISVLKTLISNHAISKVFTNFNEVEFGQKMYLLVSAAFYVFSIYQNIITFIRFYSNMKKIHDYLFNFNKYIDYTLKTMNNYLSISDKLTTYTSFNSELKNNMDILMNFKNNIAKITPLKFSFIKVTEIGHIMHTFYQLYDNNVYHKAMLYSFGFNGYLSNLYGLKTNMKDGLINKTTFSSDKKVKPIFKQMYYPKFIDDKTVVKNDCELTKNIILTGPNASGKTTTLKSVFINIIISQQFGVGCFDSLALVPYNKLHCYLNIPDTSGRDSLFQAEARRCKEIIDIIDNSGDERHLCIFDELYSGTNPEEAITSALSFMDYIVKKDNVNCVLTTHYVKLCKKLAKNDRITNFNMKTLKKNDKFKYTYLMQKGLSKLKGGLKVLSDMNYPQEILDNAK